MLAFVFIAGPTVYILKTFSTSLGNYLQQLVYTSFWVDMREGNTWQNEWTLFYWAWWISWSPFVGVFTARTGICILGTPAAYFRHLHLVIRFRRNGFISANRRRCEPL